ncbi:hypothetical protein LJY25_00805 [Hymenobacter sp. BT175]|uniref:hypothetical protein n=1 Tax=Hymenobacter translucens TaxID=2886507 RepID=UPI001D0EE45F|nr:hypothetical protein [Hymenobacter translucens]MCC2544968.1 hypothetical protein [Hymenobacter translucens]
MPAPPAVRVAAPQWVRTSSAGAAPAAPAASMNTEFPVPPAPEPVRAPLPTLRSEDGRLVLTDRSLTVNGRTYALLELESVELTPVRWLLWFLLGGVTLAGFALAFLQNWLRTIPAMLGFAAAALLLAYGQRGTNRLRLHLLGREAAHVALPGEAAPWQHLAAEVNRRIRLCHDEAAAQAAAALLPPPEPPTTLPE